MQKPTDDVEVKYHQLRNAEKLIVVKEHNTSWDAFISRVDDLHLAYVVGRMLPTNLQNTCTEMEEILPNEYFLKKNELNTTGIYGMILV